MNPGNSTIYSQGKIIKIGRDLYDNQVEMRQQSMNQEESHTQSQGNMMKSAYYTASAWEVKKY